MALIIHLEENCKSYSDLARKVVRIFCAVKDIRLSSTEEQVMAYLVTYGINRKTRYDFLIGKLVKTPDSLYSMLNKLKRLGLLLKTEGGYQLPESLKIGSQQLVGLKIKLENV